MTEKRFTFERFIEDYKSHIIDNEGKIETLEEYVNYLNNLNDENEQLRKDNKEYIRGLDLSKATSQSWASDVRELREQNCRLEKQNEQLKRKIERERNATHKQYEKWENEAFEKITELEKENEQLKQFPVKLNNRITKLEESFKALKEMETDDLNPQAVEDVATVIGMSLNALMEFRRELNGDVE